MADEITQEIKDILGQGQPDEDGRGVSTHITVGDVMGDNNTVIIGDHPRRRQEDKKGQEGDDTRCHGRRESDHAIRDELSQLRSQIKDLVQLINTQYLKDDSEDLKDDLSDDSDSLSFSDAEPSKQPDVSFCSRLYSHPLMRSKSRASSRFVPDCPIQSHFIPDVSYLMAAHIRLEYR